MSDLQKLLAELSEIVPQICQRKETEFAGIWYTIDDYEFGWHNGDFSVNYSIAMITGNPAYDWLQGALMRVIEQKRIIYEMTFWFGSEGVHYRVYDVVSKQQFVKSTLVEALLTTLIQAIKGEQ